MTIRHFIRITFLSLLFFCGVEISPASAESLFLPGYTPWGWDPGITKKCAKSLNDTTVNKTYQVLDECINNEFWGIGFASDKDLVNTCVGKFDLGNPSSPVQVNWTKEADNTWDVQFFTDFVSNTHPCGDRYFSWLVLMDQNRIRSYPRPDKAVGAYTLWYNNFLPYGTAQGAARVFAGWSGFWCTAAGSCNVRMVEIALHLEGWGDNVSDPRVISLISQPTLNFIAADGAGYGLTIAKNQDGDPTPRDIVIDWGFIIMDLVNSGYLDPPAQWDQTVTTSMSIGIETFNITPTNSIITDLHIKDFKMYEKASATPLSQLPAKASQGVRKVLQ